MKRIYEAANGVEAHMLKDLFEQEGIDAQIDGEFLQGAAGGLPPVGLVGVKVNESDIEKAKEIIALMEQSQPNSEAAISTRKKNNSYTPFISFFVGVSLGVASSVWAYNTPEKVLSESIDEKTTYRDGRVHKIEQDKNSDGRMDLIFYYDRHELVSSAKSDTDFDGVFETSIEYLRNQPLLEKSDTNGDGKIDLILRYIHGVLFSVEYISPKTGMVKKRSYYKLNKLIKSEIDMDDDGKFDSTTMYDFYEEKRS